MSDVTRKQKRILDNIIEEAGEIVQTELGQMKYLIGLARENGLAPNPEVETGAKG